MAGFREAAFMGIACGLLAVGPGRAQESCTSMVGARYAAEEVPTAITAADRAAYGAVGVPADQVFVRGPVVTSSEACTTESAADALHGEEILTPSGEELLPLPLVPYGAVAGLGADQRAAVEVAPSQSSALVLLGAQELLAPEALLPAPNSPNDLFYPLIDPAETRLGYGWSPLATVSQRSDAKEEKDLWTRLKALPNFGVAYDTGVFSGDVTKIALGDNPAAGQTQFTGEGTLENVPLELVLDTQLTAVPVLGLDQQVQVLVEADNYEDPDRLEIGHFYGRGWDLDRLALGAGKTFSLFSPLGILPATLSQNTTLIGTGHKVQDNPAQIRLQVTNPVGGGWGSGVAIEDPFRDDYTADNKLTRWPTLSGNVVYAGSNKIDRLQLSAINRSMGFQDAIGVEHFETAWGLSAYMLLATYQSSERVDGVFAGVAGGDGIGRYINGVSTSAVFDGTTFDTVEGLGAYIGYKQQWITAGGREFGSNLAYGYATMDTSASQLANENRQLHQAWANILYFPNKHVALGVEYQQGSRETGLGAHGENHRFMFVLALTNADPKPAGGQYLTKYGTSARYAVEETSPGATGTASQQAL